MNLFSFLLRRRKPKPQQPQGILMGWNAPKADSFLAMKEARDLAMGLHPGLLRWGGTVSQHKADMGDAGKLAAIAKDMGVPVVITADIYDSEPHEVLARILYHLSAGVTVVGVELGCETYLPQYRDRIPSPEVYVAKAKALQGAIKGRWPAMPCGIVMAPTGAMRDPDSSLVYPQYLVEWNRVVLTEKWPDALVLHCYVSPAKTGPTYVAHSEAVAETLSRLGPRRVWLTEVGVQGAVDATVRYAHYRRMAKVAKEAGNVDLYCWHSLAGQGPNAAINVKADRHGNMLSEYTSFGAMVV